ncbi:MAG TPA: YqaJ viral recombinase family protein [Phycisphaerae bacterium]|nr:YqaJ viral recombinase family protein [Phycisphaerae bacterium]HUW99426.1 YqaJ viral recombinase family protein [Phycisphaerae bacterium]
MKTVDAKQGSDEWLQARAGIPTASEWSNIITPAGKVRRGEMVETYLAKKLAERWYGGPLPSTYGGGALEQGSLLESRAIGHYALRENIDILPGKFITTDDGRVGCSPDGMLADGTGIECKCPAIHTQVKRLLDGELPGEYVAQVQGCMFVTGAKSWTFLSFCTVLPNLVLTVLRDDAYQESLQDALKSFLARLDAGYDRLLEINGGPPVREPARSADDSEEPWPFDFI